MSGPPERGLFQYHHKPEGGELCGVLGAFLCFSDRVVYPAYSAAPNIIGMSPLGDPVFAGALRWGFGSFV